MADVAIIPYNQRHLHDVLTLANDAFGENYLTVERISFLAARKGSFFVLQQGEKITGYCVFVYEAMQDTIKHIAGLQDLLPGDYRPDKLVCYMKSMAIAKDVKGTGAARALFGTALAKSVADGVPMAWGSAWKIGETVPMHKIFDGFGFGVAGEVPMAWYNDENYSCVYCGGRCRCDAVIYYRDLGDSK